MSTPLGGSGVAASLPAATGVPVSGNVPGLGSVPGVGGGLPGLPHAGTGRTENTSVNFLMLIGLLALAQVAVVSIIRKVSGRRPEMENDGILGI